jgi:hypothetical protein
VFLFRRNIQRNEIGQHTYQFYSGRRRRIRTFIDIISTSYGNLIYKTSPVCARDVYV